MAFILDGVLASEVAGQKKTKNQKNKFPYRIAGPITSCRDKPERENTMSHPAYAAIETRVRSSLRTNHEDFAKDQILLQELSERDPFFYFIRPNGTHLIAIEIGDGGEAQTEYLRELYQASEHVMLYDGESLTAVTPECIARVMRYFRPALL